MTSRLIDDDLILSGNEQWMKLDQDWKAVDLEEDEPTIPSPKLSTLDLRKTTFDSSYLMKKVQRKKKKSTASDLNYKGFLEDLEDDGPKELPLKQFYFISGQILSALSVEEICDKIDDIFKSVDRLCSATSTIRQKRKPLPEIVHCSISGTGLSFDETVDDEKEKCDDDDVDRYIDEAFAHLNSTIASMGTPEGSTRESVTSLVRKFSSILNSPAVNRCQRRQRHCNDKFRDLAEFWRSKAIGS